MQKNLSYLLALGMLCALSAPADARVFKHKHRVAGGITGGLLVYGGADFPDFPLILDVEYGYNITPWLELQSSLGYQVYYLKCVHAGIGVSLRPTHLRRQNPDGGGFALGLGLGLQIPLAEAWSARDSAPYGYASLGYEWRAQGGFTFGAHVRYLLSSLDGSPGGNPKPGHGAVLRLTFGRAF
jgi:hypothetical protein